MKGLRLTHEYSDEYHLPWNAFQFEHRRREVS